MSPVSALIITQCTEPLGKRNSQKSGKLMHHLIRNPAIKEFSSVAFMVASSADRTPIRWTE